MLTGVLLARKKENLMTVDNQITRSPGVPRIESLKIKNYRALKQVTLGPMDVCCCRSKMPLLKGRFFPGLFLMAP